MQTIRFNILGFDVDVQPSFLILMGIYLLFGLQRNQPMWTIASFCAIVFVSITIHELGHALMCRRLKIPVYEVALHGFGGHVRHAASRPKNNLAVSLAGPGIELVIGIPVLLFYWFGPTETYPYWAIVLMDQWVWVNVGWALVNLLPMMPLDGGNALRSYLEWRHMGPSRAMKTASAVGMAFGGVFAAIGLYLSSTIVLIIGAYSAYMNYQTWQRYGT